MKTFRELSRRARLYRMHNLAKIALAAYQLEPAHLSFLQYTANFVYRVDMPVSTSGGSTIFNPNRYVLRIHAIDDPQAISSELTWLAALSLEAGLPVPMPVLTPACDLLAKVSTPDLPKEKFVSLLHWLDGRKILKGLRPQHLKSLGRIVAQLHHFSAGWQPPSGFSRPQWDWDSLLGGSMFTHARAELVDSIPHKFQEPFECVSQAAKQVMESLGKGPDSYGMIHADLYPDNVLFKAGQAYPIDFEDCGYGYWMWDIAMALCQWAWTQDWERMRDAFYDGYAQIRTLPQVQWNQLDLFVATNFAIMLLWASDFLKSDPMRAAEHEQLRDDNGNKLLRYFARH